LEGEEERVLFLTQVRGRHSVVVAKVLRDQVIRKSGTW
jgi:hypothetical protein